MCYIVIHLLLEQDKRNVLTEHTLKRYRVRTVKITTRKKKTFKMIDVANRLAEISEAHLSKLTPSERAARLRAFKRIVFGAAETHATSERPVGTLVTRLAARGREAR